ncbi:hypothetical protein B0H11DRAFT_1921212 [Mycena galericulata]|nr:hypothetical protein B0H11DRAFT_1921212 [Mycena galericulata]
MRARKKKGAGNHIPGRTESAAIHDRREQLSTTHVTAQAVDLQVEPGRGADIENHSREARTVPPTLSAQAVDSNRTRFKRGSRKEYTSRWPPVVHSKRSSANLKLHIKAGLAKHPRRHSLSLVRTSLHQSAVQNSRSNQLRTFRLVWETSPFLDSEHRLPTGAGATKIVDSILGRLSRLGQSGMDIYLGTDTRNYARNESSPEEQNHEMGARASAKKPRKKRSDAGVLRNLVHKVRVRGAVK